MHLLLRGSLTAVIGLFVLISAAEAKRIAIPPLSDRIAKAAVVVVGKVTSIENKPVKTPNGEMAVAVVKVEAGSGEVKGLTHIKVAFPAEVIANGEEYGLFLSKVKDQNFFTVLNYNDVLRKSDGNFDSQMQVVKKAVEFLNEPKKGFTSKNTDDHLLTASLLLGKYRPWGTASDKLEAIDAAESKQILEALAAADWQKIDPVTQINAQQMFFRLALTPADGWMQPANFQQIGPAAKEWLKANADKYRVKRFVFEK